MSLHTFHRIGDGIGGFKLDNEYREPDVREKELLHKLLRVYFTGRDELCTQIDSIIAKQINSTGTLSLQCRSGSPFPGRHRLVAEGMCRDADGGTISVLLHIDQAGFMHLLEVIKYGPNPIINEPSASTMEVLLPESGGTKPGV
jgi:hypothetical protein